MKKEEGKSRQSLTAPSVDLSEFKIGRWFFVAGFAMDDVAGWLIPHLVVPQLDHAQFVIIIAGAIVIAFEYLSK